VREGMQGTYVHYRSQHPETSRWNSWADFQVVGVPVFREWSENSGVYLAHLAIIASVTESGMADQFVVGFGQPQRDLRFGVRSVEARYRDSIVIRGLDWRDPPSTGRVRIWHASFTGLVDDIERPIAEAVPLFWQFIAEKFGIYPAEHRTH
jgi:hypothetical protein